MATGIIWIGSLFRIGGYPDVTRTFLKGFADLGIPVRAINIDRDERRFLEPGICALLERLQHADPGLCPVLIMHATPDLYPHIESRGIARRIGFTIFETDRIPQSWVGLCKSVDEVWVPSAFNRATFTSSGIPESKIRVFSYGIDEEMFPALAQGPHSRQDSIFRFLYVAVFDYRKGIDLLLEAYLKEFRTQDAVSLIIKTYVGPGVSPVRRGRAVTEEIARMMRGKVDLNNPQLPVYQIISEPMTESSLRNLYIDCDLYISTDRANGWGLPCMQAMAMGRPAACIDWSGSTEFMHEDNSLLIPTTGRMVPVDLRLVRQRPLYRGHQWAEVTVEDVRRTLRRAFDRRNNLGQLGERASAYIRSSFSHRTVAQRIGEYVRSLPVSTCSNACRGVLQRERRFGVFTHTRRLY